VSFAWFTADDVHGQAKYRRSWLEARIVTCALAIRHSGTFATADGEPRGPCAHRRRLSPGPVPASDSMFGPLYHAHPLDVHM